MKLVSKKHFYKIIFDKDLDLVIKSDHNTLTKIQKTIFTYRNGVVFGYSETNHNSDAMEETGFSPVTYFINERELIP